VSFYALLFYLALDEFAVRPQAVPVGDLLKQAAAKENARATWPLGSSGWATAVVKGILCNWMVTNRRSAGPGLPLDLGKSSRHVATHHDFLRAGLRALDREYVRHTGGNAVSALRFREQVACFGINSPVTLGNTVSGALFTGLALYGNVSRQRSLVSEESTDWQTVERPETSVGSRVIGRYPR